MSEIQPSHNDAILGGQNPPPIAAAVLGGAAGEKQLFIQELGLSAELIDQLSPNHQKFSFDTVTVDRYGKIINSTKKQAFYYTEELSDSVGLDMIYIPAGSFMMGSSEEHGNDVKYPPCLVEVPAFYMSKYQITQSQYKVIKDIKRKNPFNFKGNGLLPAIKISWLDGEKFCKKLSKKTGREYHLPMETQWEYACRARTTTPFYFGETITTELANFDGYSRPYGDGPKGIFRGMRTKVGSFPANSFGLYDMHGNVEEWCMDVWEFEEADKPDWWGEPECDHVLKGGSRQSSAWQCHSAYRSYAAAWDHEITMGLRIVRNI
jgi:formylglycine-generating enzyme required for sulfatase activity